MKYSALKVWDANGLELRAYFEKNNYEIGIRNYESKAKSKIKENPKSEIPNSKLFSIVVNDEDAVYPITIDPLSKSPGWTAESDQVSATFSWSVSTAGDVNGDGYSDVIVGSDWYSNGQLIEGGAFVYHGSTSGLSATANWTAESNQESASFGNSVSAAGDVNGDGYSDVIVGALYFDSSQTDEGLAFVYYGNGTSGLRSTVRQYKPGTGNVVSSGGLTGTNGQVRLNTFGRSPFGRADGKIVYEYKQNGIPYSGAVITNSTSSSGSGTNTDFGITGVQLNNEISGLLSNKVYKWRARVQYNLVNNPYQKYGPWKYYNNYVPTPLGNFRAWNGTSILDTTAPVISYTNLSDGYDLSDRTLNNVVITDASGIEGNSGIRPRIYYKKRSQANTFNNNTNSTVGWKYSEASGSASPFSFTINYSLNNRGINYQDTIMYFVTAQDAPSGPPNVGINSGIFASAPLSVNLTSAAFPVTGIINSYKILPSVPNVLNFDGTNDNVALPTPLTQNLTVPSVSEITIEYWYKGSNIQSAVRFQTGSSRIVAGWGTLGSQKHLISTEGGTNGISVGAGVNDGNWHHFAMTWKRNTVNGFKSYLDGAFVEQRNSSDIALPNMNVAGYLGKYSEGNEYLNGTLDEVRI